MLIAPSDRRLHRLDGVVLVVRRARRGRRGCRSRRPRDRSAASTSCRTSSKFGLPEQVGDVGLLAGEEVVEADDVVPASTSRSHRCEPRNPAPPVTSGGCHDALRSSGRRAVLTALWRSTVDEATKRAALAGPMADGRAVGSVPVRSLSSSPICSLYQIEATGATVTRAVRCLRRHLACLAIRRRIEQKMRHCGRPLLNRSPRAQQRVATETKLKRSPHRSASATSGAAPPRSLSQNGARPSAGWQQGWNANCF